MRVSLQVSYCVGGVCKNERERESTRCYSFGDFIIGRLFFSLSLSSKKKKNKQEQNFRWDHRCIKINTDSIIFASRVVYIFYYLMESMMIYVCVAGWVCFTLQLQLQPFCRPGNKKCCTWLRVCVFFYVGFCRPAWLVTCREQKMLYMAGYNSRSGSLTTSIKATWWGMPAKKTDRSLFD